MCLMDKIVLLQEVCVRVDKYEPVILIETQRYEHQVRGEGMPYHL